MQTSSSWLLASVLELIPILALGVPKDVIMKNKENLI